MTKTNNTTNNMNINARREGFKVTIVSADSLRGNVGRHVCKCPSCNGFVNHSKWVKIESMRGFADNGHARYIGLECFLPLEYHTCENYVNVNKDGTQNTTTSRKPHVSVEFEIVSQKYGTGIFAVKSAFGFDYPELSWQEKIERGYIDIDFCSVYLRLLFLGYQKNKRSNHIESDCTVSAEGHCWFKSLQGLSRFLNECTESELKCFRDVRCGAHIHASCEYAREAWCGVNVFKPVLKKIEELTPSERSRRFGSDFRGFASDNVGGHGCCINYRTRHNTIEFRLSRIHDNTQFIQCCKWWRGTIAVVNNNGHKVNIGKWTPQKLGMKCAEEFEKWDTKYAKGM